MSIFIFIVPFFFKKKHILYNMYNPVLLVHGWNTSDFSTYNRVCVSQYISILFVHL